MRIPMLIVLAVFALVAAACGSNDSADVVVTTAAVVDGGDGDGSDSDGEDPPEDEQPGDDQGASNVLFNPDTGLPEDACILLSPAEVEAVTGIEFAQPPGGPFQCIFGTIETGEAWNLLFFRTNALNNGDANFELLFDGDEPVDGLGDRAMWSQFSVAITIQIDDAIASVSGKFFDGDEAAQQEQATELALIVLDKAVGG